MNKRYEESTEKELQMALKHMKSCSISLTTREREIKLYWDTICLSLSKYATSDDSFLEDCSWGVSLLSSAVHAKVTSVVSNSLWPSGPQPTRLLCRWDSPGKNTGVDCHARAPGDLPDPGIEPASLMSPALAGGFLTTSSTTWEALVGCWLDVKQYNPYGGQFGNMI